MSRTLLIDADLIAYRCTAACQTTIDWNGDGECVTVDGHWEEARKAAEAEIDMAMEKLTGHDLIVCMSDEVVNFRKTLVDPTYKMNRSGTKRPELLYELKDWIAETYPHRLMPRLEADDVMGILATEPCKEDRIMVSLDKDMGTVPALWCKPVGDWKVRSVTPAEANRFHLWQTLCGDQTDGYPGAPGCGPKAADAILDHLKEWVPHSWEITRGKRKGTIETKWELTDSEADDWTRVVSAYRKIGQGEAEAIKQARLAFILRHGSVDGHRIQLWNPPK